MSKGSIFELLKKVEEDHDVDLSSVEEFIESLDSEKEGFEDLSDDLESQIKLLKSNISSLEDEVLEEQSKYDNALVVPSGVNNSIILDGALKDLFANLHRIPAIDIQKFVDKYAI